MIVNNRLSAPESPGWWVGASTCICGEYYSDFRAGCRFGGGVQRVRDNNPDEVTDGELRSGGGYRSRGPVLWAMRVDKLSEWYEYHRDCGYGKTPPLLAVGGVLDGDDLPF